MVEYPKEGACFRFHVAGEGRYALELKICKFGLSFQKDLPPMEELCIRFLQDGGNGRLHDKNRTR